MPILACLAFCVAVVVVSGCAELQVVTPNPRIENPQVQTSEKPVTLKAAIEGAHIFKVTANAGSRPPDLTGSQELDRTNDEVIEGRYLIFEPVELGIGLNFLGLGFNALAKVQILGPGQGQTKAGSITLGAYGRAGTNQGSNSGDQKDTFGPAGYDWKGTITNTYVHWGASLGVFVSEPLQIFAGGAWGNYWAKTKISQDPSDDGTDAGGAYSQTDPGWGRTAGGGLAYTLPNLVINANYEYTHISYRNVSAINHGFLSAGISVSF